MTESLPVLRTLLQLASSPTTSGSNQISILPGSGIGPQSIGLVLEALLPCGLCELHLSAGSWIAGGMEYRPPGMGMGVGGDRDWDVWRTSEQTVREVKNIVDSASKAINSPNGQ